MLLLCVHTCLHPCAALTLHCVLLQVLPAARAPLACGCLPSQARGGPLACPLLLGLLLRSALMGLSLIY